jgi:transcription elongation GreA/GreB family factor
VQDKPSAGGVVGFGSTVRVEAEDGAEHTWRIVSSHDAAPAEGRLSADSPVAVALLGRGSGDTVSVALPRGKRKFTVLSVD